MLLIKPEIQIQLKRAESKQDGLCPRFPVLLDTAIATFAYPNATPITRKQSCEASRGPRVNLGRMFAAPPMPKDTSMHVFSPISSLNYRHIARKYIKFTAPIVHA